MSYGEQHSYDGLALRGTGLLHGVQMVSEEEIISPEAMYDSAVKCKKGKLYKSQVANFWLHGIEESWKLSNQLKSGTYNIRMSKNLTDCFYIFSIFKETACKSMS